MTIAIIDSYPILRFGLAAFLKEHFTDLVIVELDKIAVGKTNPVENIDLAILGMSQFPHLNNLTFINDVKMWCPAAKLIAYDEQRELSMVPGYFQAGVHGYVSKQADPGKLIDCIADVVRMYV